MIPPTPGASLCNDEVGRYIFDVESLGKTLMIAGAAVMVIGIICWWFGPRWSGGPIFPGDISIRRGNFSFYFPVVTCLVISVVLTFLMRLFNR